MCIVLSKVLLGMESAGGQSSSSVSIATTSNDLGTTSTQSDSYMSLLRRISWPTSTPSQDPAMADIESNPHIISLLLQQPPEIIHHVLYWLEPGDLLSLRMTNKILHNLIHQSERAICLTLPARITRGHGCHVSLCPVPDLSSFFRMYRTFESVCKVATIVADRISGFMKSRAHSGDKQALNDWRQRKIQLLKPKLKRCLIILQHYLNFLARTIVRNDFFLQHLADDEYLALHNIYDLDMQDFMAREMDWLSEADFTDVSAVYAILKAVCKGRNVPLTLKSLGFPFASMKQILIYRGLSPLGKLLPPEVDLAQQNKILRRLCEDIAHQNRTISNTLGYQKPLDSIYHLSPKGERDTYFQRRGSKVRDQFMTQQDIWDKAARAFMMRKLGRFPSVQSTTVWIQKTVVEQGEREADVVVGPWDMP